jgi:hypothetical protein
VAAWAAVALLAGCESRPANQGPPGAARPASPAGSAAPAASGPAAAASARPPSGSASAGQTAAPAPDAGAKKKEPPLACPLVDAWGARVPKQKGERPLKVIFYDDGRASWNRTAGTFTGTWRQEGTHLVFVDGSTESARGCGKLEGRYAPTFAAACATMKLAPLSDGCGERRAFIAGATFSRQ